MWAKVVVVGLMLVILYCLGSAMVHLISTKQNDAVKMARALTWRIALSVIVFGLLVLSFFMGWITPHHIMVAPR